MALISPSKAFASNAKTKSMTMKTAIPLTPDLAIPSKKTHPVQQEENPLREKIGKIESYKDNNTLF